MDLFIFHHKLYAIQIQSTLFISRPFRSLFSFHPLLSASMTVCRAPLILHPLFFQVLQRSGPAAILWVSVSFSSISPVSTFCLKPGSWSPAMTLSVDLSHSNMILFHLHCCKSQGLYNKLDLILVSGHIGVTYRKRSIISNIFKWEDRNLYWWFYYLLPKHILYLGSNLNLSTILRYL